MKKKSTKSIIALLIVVMFGFYQCTNDDPLFSGFPTEWDYASLQDVHDEMTISDTIQLTLADPTIENTITGPKGIRIDFPANAFTGSGEGEVVAPIKIELIEIFKRGEIIQHRAQTFATQTPLVSGGMFWIRATDAAGVELNFSGANAHIPYKTDANGFENDVKSYTGSNQTMPSGNVLSWTAGTLVVNFDPNAGANGEFTMEDIKPNWNHAAAEYTLSAEEATQFGVNIPNADFAFAEVFFALNDYTVVGALTNVEGENLNTFAASVPKNATGKLVAIAIIDGKLNFATQDITIAGDDLFVMNLTQGTSAELKAALNGIN